MPHHHRFGLLTVAALAVASILPAGAAHADAPPATVVSLDTANSIYSNQGAAGTLLRQGRPDLFPLATSLDGATSIWYAGSAFEQMYLVRNGHIVHAEDNYTDDPIAADVSADGTRAVMALDQLGGLSIVYLDGVTGARSSTPELQHPESLLSLSLQPGGVDAYVLKAGSPATLTEANGEVARPLVGLPAASPATTWVEWMATSPDDTTVVLALADMTRTPVTHHAYLITGTNTTTPAVTDAGPLSDWSAGRFVGTSLLVSMGNQMHSYATVGDFPAGGVSTSFPVVGTPWLITDPAATLNTSITTPTPFTTISEVVRLAPTASYIVPAVSTYYLGTSVDLVPALHPARQVEWNNWNNYDVWAHDTCLLQYSNDKRHWYAFDWANRHLPITRNTYVRARHTTDINSLASISATVLIYARPRATIRYTAVTRHLYGTANVSTGTLIQVQRRTSSRGRWTVYSARIRVTAGAWSLTLPRGRAQWRVVVPRTSRYVAAVTATVTSR